MLTSWPGAGAEAEVLAFFRIFCGGVCGRGPVWEQCLQESTPLRLTVLGVCGFMSQVELSNPRARFRQESWTWGRDSSQNICYPTE